MSLEFVECRVVRLGIVDYAEALKLQRLLVAARIADRIADHLLLLSHPDVVSLGRPSSRRFMKFSEQALNRRGVDVVEAGRGGEVTFHGPGQVIAYPILKLREGERDLHQYLRRLEQVGVHVCCEFGIPAETDPGRTGVWVGGEKIAAIGVRATSWTTYHGLALNRTRDLRGFGWIVPCGLENVRATSLEAHLAREPALRDVEDAVIDGFKKLFLRSTTEISAEQFFLGVKSLANPEVLGVA